MQQLHQTISSCIHKGVSHVLKPMIKSTIMVELVPIPIPKPRMTLVQGGENDMNITMPTTTASNSINHIHIQFRTFLLI
jgi:hypothetical protein